MISPDLQIKPSIFETNSFLLKREPTLIEYSVFYGSIEIFNFLRMSKAEMKSSLWLYSIHGRNPEIICHLEENKIRKIEEKYNAKYFEVSAKRNENINEAFECIAKKLYTSISEETNKLQNLINNNNIAIDGNGKEKKCLIF